MDIKSQQERSKNMAAIRSRNTSPELYLRKLLFARGYRYRVNVSNIPGHPDLYLRKYNTAVFVNGCFWHRHEGCRFAYTPKSRVEFWQKKFEANKRRDMQVRAELEEIWEKTKKTILYVTHSVEEAIYFADRVVVMAENPGQIKQIIPIRFARPRNIEAPEFTALRRQILDQVSLSARKSMADEFDRPEVKG